MTNMATFQHKNHYFRCHEIYKFGRRVRLCHLLYTIITLSCLISHAAEKCVRPFLHVKSFMAQRHFYLPWARDEVLGRGLIGYTVKILFFIVKILFFLLIRDQTKIHIVISSKENLLKLINFIASQFLVLGCCHIDHIVNMHYFFQFSLFLQKRSGK